jgi:CheY-like chemotaxis protein
MIVAFLTSDLVFPSRISPTVERLGGRLLTAANVDSIEEKLMAAGSEPVIIILDLNSPGADPAAAVSQWRQSPAPPRTIIAFAPHVHGAKLAAARSAGCDIVLTRGEFNSQIEGLLSMIFSKQTAAAKQNTDR